MHVSNNSKIRFMSINDSTICNFNNTKKNNMPTFKMFSQIFIFFPARIILNCYFTLVLCNIYITPEC